MPTKLFTFVPMKFLRPFIAIVLLIGIMINCFNYFIISASYAFNKNYIATVLCTNKNHPELHCDGKCFMDIKLKELAQKNKQEQDQLKRVIETVAPELVSFLAPVYEIEVADSPTFYLHKKPIKTAISIFHPPKQA